MQLQPSVGTRMRCSCFIMPWTRCLTCLKWLLSFVVPDFFWEAWYLFLLVFVSPDGDPWKTTFHTDLFIWDKLFKSRIKCTFKSIPDFLSCTLLEASQNFWRFFMHERFKTIPIRFFKYRDWSWFLLVYFWFNAYIWKKVMSWSEMPGRI